MRASAPAQRAPRATKYNRSGGYKTTRRKKI